LRSAYCVVVRQLRTTQYALFFTMNRWVRRLIYTLIALVWLFLMLLPAFSFLLAARGELTLGSNPHSQVRFFLLSNADAEGVGIEWTRPLRTTGETCTRTSVRYLLWAGEGEPVSTCRCYSDTGAVSAVDPPACR
jgi:hypothetical protein